MNGLRLAIPAAVAWIATALVVGMPAAIGVCAVVAWSIGVGAAVIGAVRRGRGGVGLLAMVVLSASCAGVVLTSAASQAPARSPEVLSNAAAAARPVSAVATTTQAVTPGATRFTAVLESVSVGNTTVTVSSPVAVFLPRSSTTGATPAAAKHAGSRLELGSSVALSGRVVATEPGDTSAFLFFSKTEPSVRAGPAWYLAWANGLRTGFADAVHGLPGDGAALLPGLAIGDTSAVGPTLDQAMKTSSLSHLTAVSGANCAVLTALVMAAGAALGIRRGWRIGACVVVLVGFVVLVTPQPSVLRAAVMALLVLLTMAGGRPARGVTVLALAVVVLLAVDPWLARNYGFTLSVLATGGLLFLARPLAGVLARWVPRPLALVIAIPLAAQVACQPVLILLSPSIPLYAVPANMLAEPAAPVATVLGLIACVLMPWSASAALFVARLAWLPSSWIAADARFFATLPGSSVPWVGGAVGAVLVGTVIVLLLLLLVARSPRMRRWRAATALVLALGLVVAVGAIAGNGIRQATEIPGDWQIAACDIGQGDAVLVRSAGQIALIDTGPDPKPLRRCLDVLHVRRIDLLVLTHYDLDHVGGTDAVLGMVDLALIGPPADDRDRRLSKSVRDAGARVQQVSRGIHGALGELRWRVLWPPSRPGVVAPGNDSSVTVSFAGGEDCADGCLTSLFLGDLGNESQIRMLAANRALGHVDVVKVAHHGSADQEPELYRRVSARLGVISVGAHNRYGHPTDRLLDILRSAGTRAERTDRQGMILISPRTDGGMSVWSER